MDENVAKFVLNGLLFKHFILLFAWAAVGALLSFWVSVERAKKFDAATDREFRWKHVWKGAKRTIITMVVIAFSIIYWEQLSGLMFDSETAIELTGFSAFLYIGAGSDKITQAIFGGSKEAGQYIIKKLK